MTLAELLEAGLQLPGDMWTMLSLGCFTPMGYVNRSLWTDPGGAKHLFSSYRCIWTLKSYQVLFLPSSKYSISEMNIINQEIIYKAMKIINVGWISIWNFVCLTFLSTSLLWSGRKWTARQSWLPVLNGLAFEFLFIFISPPLAVLWSLCLCHLYCIWC